MDKKCPVQPMSAIPSVAGDGVVDRVVCSTGLIIMLLDEFAVMALLHDVRHMHSVFCHSLPPMVSA